MGKYNTVIFDLDGTLLDTLEDLTDAVNEGLLEFGFPPRSLSEVSSFVGTGVRNLMGYAVPKGTSEEQILMCLERFKTHYEIHYRDKTKPYPGIMELLEAIKALGISIGVMSNKYEAVVKELCDDYFPGLINGIRGERKNVLRKPAPDGVNSLLAELGSQKSETIYIGDTEIDMKTGTNADLFTVGVTCGFRNEKILRKNGGKKIIYQPKELMRIIEEI
ncbi:MAG: HAD family hydrolase [Anaerovoracaceae bacterium]